ncbi:iodotyrosine deiodinase isoform X1 [Wyeomyia smithii]|uniref:iodotyrosine deiodinase isoform X1 n=1 Tax=Wyeomyia smithii TaxID=174621 RepID=UPI002467EED8|nr:iodotyrosine deiodinase isoform X1 [Wyeomyia smithii]
MPPKRKAPTTDEDDDEYRKKRDRNNQAVKRSRVKSKQRTEETQQTVNDLRVKNKVLEDKIKHQTKDLKFLKELFLAQAQAKSDKLVGVNLAELLKSSDEETDEADNKESSRKKCSSGSGRSAGSRRKAGTSKIDLYEFDPIPVLEEKEHIPFKGATVTLDADPRKAAARFYEIVNDRRSVRSFSTRPIDSTVVEKCIHAAGCSPSGAHTEPWTFCLVSDQNIKEQIREIIEAEEFVNYQQRMSKQWTTDLKPLRTNHVKQYLSDAPCLVLIFKQTYGFKADGSKKQHYYNEISTSIAVGILLCALQAAGLSSLVTTPLNCGPALRSLLGRPTNEKLLVLLPIGYAAEDCTVPDLKRKPIDRILVKY